MENQVCVSKEIYQSLWAILRISRVSGICPIRVVKKGNSYHFEKSKKVVAYSYVFVTAMICYSVYGLVQIYGIKEVMKVRFNTVTGMVCTIIQNSFFLSSFGLGVFLTPFFHRHLWKYLQCLNQADVFLGYPNLNQSKKCFKVTFITLITTFILSGVDIALSSYTVAKNRSLVVYILSVLPLYIVHMYHVVIELHFWILVHLIKVRLIVLNTTFLKFVEEVQIFENFAKSNEYMHRKLITVVSHHGGLTSYQPKKNKVTTSDRIMQKLKDVISIHNSLSEATIALNGYFGMNALIVLLGCVLYFLVGPYILYLQIRETKNFVCFTSQITWIFCQILKLIFLIEPCQNCKSQIQATANIACKLLHLDVGKNLQNQLKLILMQLDKCKIEFTACHLVTIDRTLLATVAGTVTTYLVILFQFK